MDWKTRDQTLTVPDAKAQLRAVCQEPVSIPFVSRNPLRAVLAAFAVGFLFSKGMPALRRPGKATWLLIGRLLLSQMRPSSPALQQLRARAHRQDPRTGAR